MMASYWRLLQIFISRNVCNVNWLQSWSVAELMAAMDGLVVCYNGVCVHGGMMNISKPASHPSIPPLYSRYEGLEALNNRTYVHLQAIVNAVRCLHGTVSWQRPSISIHIWFLTSNLFITKYPDRQTDHHTSCAYLLVYVVVISKSLSLTACNEDWPDLGCSVGLGALKNFCGCSFSTRMATEWKIIPKKRVKEFCCRCCCCFNTKT